MPAPENQWPAFGIILLAAGQSLRLGRPKQLLAYKGKTLLQHSIDEALQSRAAFVNVVLGYQAAEMQAHIDATGISTIINNDWEEGMGSSIRAAVHHCMQEAKTVEGIILMVCDQPFVHANIINQLIEAHQRNAKAIIASSYAGTVGPPVLFHKSLFPALLQVAGDTGAKPLTRQFAHMLDSVPFPEGAFDVDTLEDFQQLHQE